MRSWRWVTHKAVLPVAFACVPAFADLNHQAIHTAYNDGDFDRVTAEIDAFTKSGNAYSRADSIFICKHLAVVYSANPATREKGRYYMRLLLELMPSTELLDMYVSDEILQIFERVRKELAARRQSASIPAEAVAVPADSARGGPRSDSAGRDPASIPARGLATTAVPEPAKPRRNTAELRKMWMAGGAVGAVTLAAVGAYVLMFGRDEPAPTSSPERIDVEVLTPK